MSQLNLFDSGPVKPNPPHCGKDTSRQAAKRVAHATPTMRERVFAFIRDRGAYGATDRETQDALRLGPDSQRPRRCELVKSGHVIDSGKCRTNASGAAAIVWIATAKPYNS